LGGPQHLPEALIFSEVESPITAIVELRQNDWATLSEPEFIAHKWRDAAVVADHVMVEIIAGVESRIANELEHAAV